MQKKILITTGGSGGHVIPALILYNHLFEKFDVLITTDKRGLDFFDKKINKFKIINTPRLNNIFLLPVNFFKILFLTFKSYFLIKGQNIEKIISTGGYMSLPLILAAKFCKLKIYLLEPNLVLGRANRFFLGSCEKIFCYSNEIKDFPNQFMISPIFGGWYPEVKSGIGAGYYSHSLILSIITHTGLLGFILFTFGIFKIIFSRFRIIKFRFFDLNNFITFQILATFLLASVSYFFVFPPFWFLIGISIHGKLKISESN